MNSSRSAQVRRCVGGISVATLVFVSGPLMAQQAERGNIRRSETIAKGLVSGFDSTQATSPAAILRGSWTGPDGATARRSAFLPQTVDSWGVERNFGVAAAEVIGINLFVWAFNEYIRGANFTQVNPRSWWDNITAGFNYDDNHFNTNMFAHPFHGSLYFSAARSNGFNYWLAAPFAIAGSFLWECCGETHRMSSNDWIATSLGGITIGEMTYRLSGTVLDNTATGKERTWREIGALAINPMRGFNRLVSGRWSAVGDNPPDRFPLSLSNQLVAGVRVIGEGESITENTQTNAFFEVQFRYGGPFSGENRDPYDFFLFDAQVNFSEKQALGRLQIRGNLFSTPLKRSDKVTHIFNVGQAFDYFNNFAYEFGSQSFTASIFSDFRLGNDWDLVSLLDGYAMVQAAVNSDFAFLAEFPPDFDQERLREYDFGPGAAAALSLIALKGGRDLLTLRYRFNYIYTLNGSVQEGDEAFHYVHIALARAKVPVSRGFGLGADFALFLRDSYYSCSVCADTRQRNPEMRLYGFWQVGERRGM